MMHSSLSSLGYVDGGAETVVDAILDVIGSAGPILVPAFRDSVWGNVSDFAVTDCCPCPQRLCPSKQPGFQGIIPETVRQRNRSLRSCHPTHSWVALGSAAERLLAGHCDSPTPCGRGNLAVDALQKARRMLRTWADGPQKPPNSFNHPLAPLDAPVPGDTIRQDCPAFAGFHEASGESIPLCRANGRHPGYFRLGGIFNRYGPTTCSHCSWHLKFDEG